MKKPSCKNYVAKAVDCYYSILLIQPNMGRTDKFANYVVIALLLYSHYLKMMINKALIKSSKQSCIL